MKQIIRHVTGLLLASVISLSAAHAAEKVTFQLGYPPSGGLAHYYLAREAGFFAAEGLDVQILPGKGGSDTLTKVATGTIDLGETGLNSLMQANIATPVPVKAVMAILTEPPDALLTTGQSGIVSLKDVAGKKIATSPFTSSNLHWPFLLKQNGVDPASVTLIKADASALVPMLAEGQADGIVAYYSHATEASSVLKEAGKTLKVIPWSDYGLAGYSNSIVTSDQFLKTKRDIVVRFVRALQKGVALTRQDPGRAARALKASVPEIDVVLAEAAVRDSAPGMFNAESARDGLGVFSPALVKTTWEWVAKEEGVPTDKLDPSSLVDYTIAK
jgi:NitT/TauT family transport system substrate-binding protein